MMWTKFLRNLTFTVLLLSLVSISAQAQRPPMKRSTMGQISLRGRIVQLNEDYKFVVINMGSSDGVKKGMIFSVFQRDEEAAKIKVSKVRRNISACDIQLIYSGRGIGAGDLVIYKEKPRIIKIFKPLEPIRIIDVEPIVVDIDAPKQTILRKTLGIFKEFGVVVTDSDPTKYTVKAQKNFELPLDVGLVAEWGPCVRNKVYYTAEVTTTPRYNRLIIRLRGVYDREGQVFNREIEKNSYTYQEAQEIAFTIKDLSERL